VEIRELVGRFVDSARRAAEAGFDAVNLHAAHGYLINAFLSPYSNHRVDEYGGDIEGRNRFLCEIIDGVRRELGNELAIIVRLSVDEFVAGGLEPGDVRAIALAAEQAGADAIDISAAIYDSAEPHQVSPWGWPEAPLATDALFVKQGVTVPVLVANRIHHPDVAERVLTSGSADFVCMGRPLLADPDLPRKIERGATREVRWCISCNECVSSELRGDRDTIADHSVFCAVNPAAAREREYARPRTGPARRVVVVGAGFSGLEAATTLAQRGHTVELWEERHEIGGQALYAARVPHKRHELEQLMAYYRYELERLEVEVHLGRRALPERLGAHAADVVVIATGERQRPPRYDIPADGPTVVGFGAILGEGEVVGERVLVVGGGFAGADTATFLADEDPTRRITLVTRWERVLPKMAPINRHVAIKKLAGLAGVTIHTGMTSLRFESGGIVVETADGGRWNVEADHVVNAGGMAPEVELYESLAASPGKRELHAAGGCVGAATFLQAIHGGARVGHAV
jgi:thioredoxin reductase